jgi:hypothetical protein
LADVETSSEPTVESLSKEVADLKARLERVDPRPVPPQPIAVDAHLKRALKLMGGDAEKAAVLFTAWMGQDGDLQKAIVPELVREYIRINIARLQGEEMTQ